MKIKAFLSLSLLFSITTVQLSAQTSDQQGGTLIDTYIVTLCPGVTMNQYVDFLKTKYVSEYVKNFPGSKIAIVSPDFWMKKNQCSILTTIKDLDKYFTIRTEWSAETKTAWEKMNPVKQEEGKYILDKRRVENEWEQWMDTVRFK
jgi:hypothetical protein